MCKNTNDNNSLNCIQILFEEWKFRLSQYWNITSKTVILNFILFFIPYMKDAWGVNSLNLSNKVFPIAGILFALCTCIISTVEMVKINKIKDTIKKYVSDNYLEFKIAYSFNEKLKNSIWLKLHHCIPVCIFVIQVIIGIIIYITVKQIIFNKAKCFYIV